jgi:hypothetical protein
MARLTDFGSQYVALAVGNVEDFIIDEFVFAFIPGLDFRSPEPGDESIPTDGLIVHRSSLFRHGVVDDNRVTFSQMLDTDIGDFNFNWIGLVGNNQLVAFAYVPSTQKIKQLGSIEGNTISRNFVIEHLGIANAMPVQVSAQSWMYDYSDEVSLLKMSSVTTAVSVIGAKTCGVKNAHWNMRLSEQLRQLGEL